MLNLIPGSLEAAKIICEMDLDPIDTNVVAKIITKHCSTYELRESIRKKAEQEYRIKNRKRKSIYDHTQR